MKKRIGILIFVLAPVLAWGQRNLTEKTFEGTSKEKNPIAARQEIMNQALQRVSEQMIKDIIGEAKFNKNKSLIAAKIIKNSARYVPFSKPGELQPASEGFKMTALLRVSREDLEALLLEHGLFYEGEATPVVLPAVRFVDKVNGKSYFWWASADTSQKTFLVKQSKSLENHLKASFSKHQFYFVKAQNFNYSQILPESMKMESLRKEDWQALAQRLGAQILLEGEVVMSKSQARSDSYAISLRLIATQNSNGRVIAEVARNFETNAGSFEASVDRQLKEAFESSSTDLSAQLFEAWQKGSLGASLYRLTLRGRLPMVQQEEFKEALKGKIREVKNIRERLISAEALVFEVDSALSPKELSQKVAEIDLNTFKIVLESTSEREVFYRLAK